METPVEYARRTFWEIVTSNKWAWLCIAAAGLLGTAAGIWLSWGHGRLGTTLVTVACAAVGLVLGLGFCFVGLAVSGISRVYGDALEQTMTRLDALEQRQAQVGRTEQGIDPQRVALMAVRSELGACAARVNAAKASAKWWNPDDDPLPAIQFREQYAALADPSVPEAIHWRIERAYQGCDLLNHRVRRYMRNHNESHPFAPIAPRFSYGLREGDVEAMTQSRHEIDDANIRISNYLNRVEEYAPADPDLAEVDN